MFWIEVLYHINALHYLCKSLHYLFILTVLLEKNQQLVLEKSRLSISSFVDYSFGVILENCPTPDHKDILQCSLFVSFMVIDYMFRCMICLEIFVYGALYASKLIFFSPFGKWMPVIPAPFVKKILSFSFTPLSKISCPSSKIGYCYL